MQTAVPSTLMRGGTSKGAYFLATDLPSDAARRDRVLLAVMGSPDPRQIDGVGGANPLTSKVAIVGRPTRPDADVDYLFLQVFPDKALVDPSQNCGNILAGVGPFAIEHGLVPATGDVTRVRIHMVNSAAIVIASIETPGGQVNYEGSARIDGVPGTAAPIALDFLDVAGSACGALLPTGRVLDSVNGLHVTLIDNGMPVIVVRAADLGMTGAESPAALEGDAALRDKVERLRLAAAPLMRLGDVRQKTIPKITLISPSQAGGTIATRTFIPHRVHETIGIFGAVSVASACMLPGSVAFDMARLQAPGADGVRQISVEHPGGFFTLEMQADTSASPVRFERSALLRTARKLMEGRVFVPGAVWDGRL